jgi:hypothetical protein
MVDYPAASMIVATAIICNTARRVARGAHRRVLGMTPPASGVRRFSWNGWQITGDLRGNSDRYVAKRGSIVSAGGSDQPTAWDPR